MVEHPLRLGIADVVHLEAAVEQHAVDAVGADPAADDVLRLVYDDLDPGVKEVAGAGQPGQSCSDDDDFRHGLSVGVDNRHGSPGGAWLPR